MPFCPKQKPQPSTITRRQLRKLEAQAEFDALELELFRQQHNLLALWFEHFKATQHTVVSNEENQGRESKEVDFNLPPVFDDYGEEEGKEEDVEDALEKTQEKEIMETNKGEMFFLEQNWSDHEDEDEQQMNSIHTVPSDPYLLIFDDMNHAPIVSSTKITPPMFVNDVLKPRPNEAPFFPPNQNPSHMNDKRKEVFKTKQDLFAWLILFQPFTLFTPILLRLFVLFYQPLTKKFCHKDKWKEPTLVL